MTTTTAALLSVVKKYKIQDFVRFQYCLLLRFLFLLLLWEHVTHNKNENKQAEMTEINESVPKTDVRLID